MTSPRSLRRPEPQVVDWSKPSPFHVPCVRCCVDKSTPTVVHPDRPCFPPHLQGCDRLKSRVLTFFDPLSSCTVAGTARFSGLDPTPVTRVTTAFKHVQIAIARYGGVMHHKYTRVQAAYLLSWCYSFNNRLHRLRRLRRLRRLTLRV